MAVDKGMLATVDTVWFDEDPEHWLSREDFGNFAEVSKVDLRDLISADNSVVRQAQDALVNKSIILDEIQRAHAGFGFPVFVYTLDPVLFGRDLSSYDPSVDSAILSFDMCDSLRRRHNALSYVLLPTVLSEIFFELGAPLVVKNLGAGLGLDTIRTTMVSNGTVAAVHNYDTCEPAIQLGEQTVAFLGANGQLDPAVFSWQCQSFTESREKSHLSVMIGVICGLQDRAAKIVLRQAWKGLCAGGKLVVSSSNHHMRCTDALSNFLIQHIGTRKHPREGWGLNFRTAETMLGLLEDAGFRNVKLYDDANMPGLVDLPENIRFGVETLPADAQGRAHSGKPISLPPREILDRKIGYNWLAVAIK
jgi:hypothetical protein